MPTEARKRARVSFIVTYHNESVEMLTECLDSILRLSLSKRERQVIVVDDGSDYSPINDLLSYGDEIVYIRKPCGGLSSARNMGLELAGGEYVQFVDADDYLVSAAYERCLDVVRYKSSPDVVMFRFTRKPPMPLRTFKEAEGPMTGSEYMRRNNLHAAAWGYIFKRDILHGLRFTEGIVHEDEEFTPQLILRADHLFLCSDEAYYYRERKDSITTNEDKQWNTKRLDDREAILLKLFHLSAVLPHHERLAMLRRVDQLTMDYLYNIIVSTHSRKELDGRIERLKKVGLFPLSKRDYTFKYSLFRFVVNNSLGRNLLLLTLRR